MLENYLPEYNQFEINQLLKDVRTMGVATWRPRLENGAKCLELLKDPAMTPEKYDGFRVGLGLVSMLRTISRKWEDLPEIQEKEHLADIAISQAVFGYGVTQGWGFGKMGD